MVALVSTIGRFHFSQQRIHFFKRKLPIGTNRRVACHCREKVVAGIFYTIALSRFGDIRQDIAQ